VPDPGSLGHINSPRRQYFSRVRRHGMQKTPQYLYVWLPCAGKGQRDCEPSTFVLGRASEAPLYSEGG